MDDAEWAKWHEANTSKYLPVSERAKSPCTDCTKGFAAEMRRIDKCDGKPGRG